MGRAGWGGTSVGARSAATVALLRRGTTSASSTMDVTLLALPRAVGRLTRPPGAGKPGAGSGQAEEGWGASAHAQHLAEPRRREDARRGAEGHRGRGDAAVVEQHCPRAPGGGSVRAPRDLRARREQEAHAAMTNHLVKYWHKTPAVRAVLR